MIFAGLSFNVSISVNPPNVMSIWARSHHSEYLEDTLQPAALKRFYIRQVFCLTVTSKPLCMSCTVFLVFECVWHFDQIVMLSHRSSAVGRRTLDTNVATCRTWLQKMFPNNLQRRGSKKDGLTWESPKMSEIQKLTNNFGLADLQLTLLCTNTGAFKQQLAVKAHSWFLAENPVSQKSPCLL